MNISRSRLFLKTFAIAVLGLILSSTAVVGSRPAPQTQPAGRPATDLRSQVVSILDAARENEDKLNDARAQIESLGDGAIGELVALASDDARRNHADAVLVLLGTRAVPHLIRALQSAPGPARANAADVLGAIDDNRKYDPLFSALGANDRNLRRAALHAILGLTRAFAARADLDTMDSFNLQSKLLPALAENPKLPELVDPLVKLLVTHKTRPYVVQGLIRRPNAITDQVVLKALSRGAPVEALREYLAKQPIPEAVPHMRAAYLSGSRSWDLEAYVKTGNPDAVRLVRDLLAQTGASAPGPNAFEAPIKAIYETPNQEGWERLPDLLERLSERDRYVQIDRIPRRKAQPEIVRYLVSLLDRKPVEVQDTIIDPRIRDFAARAAAALERLDAREAVGAILSRWHVPEIRTQAFMLVARHAGPEAVPRLLESIRNRDYAAWHRVESALALAAPPERLSALCTDPDAEVRKKAAAALARFGGGVANGALLELARDNDDAVRATAVALMDAGPARTFGTSVVAALSDRSPGVRREAIRVAGALKLRGTVPALSSALRKRPGEAEDAALSLSAISIRSSRRSIAGSRS